MFFLLMSQANDERFLCHIPAYKAVSEEDAIKLVSAMEKILVKYIPNNMKTSWCDTYIRHIYTYYSCRHTTI